MDLRTKCKNKEYAKLIIQICKTNHSCKYCCLSEQSCKYHHDNKTAWKSDSEYCFDHVRRWVSMKGFYDFEYVEI